MLPSLFLMQLSQLSVHDEQEVAVEQLVPQ